MPNSIFTEEEAVEFLKEINGKEELTKEELFLKKEARNLLRKKFHQKIKKMSKKIQSN